MTALTTNLTSLMGWPLVAVVAAMVFLETAMIFGVILPAEITLGAAAIVAAQGHVDVVWLGGAAIAAAFLGDLCGFLLGRRFGHRFHGSRLGRVIGQRRWDKTSAMVERHGSGAVIFGRWIGVARTLIPRLDGMSGMSLRRFAATDAIAVSVWATGIVTLGYLAGGSVATLKAHVGLATAALAGALGVWLVITRIRNNRNAIGATERTTSEVVVDNDGSVIAPSLGVTVRAADSGRPRTFAKCH